MKVLLSAFLVLTSILPLPALAEYVMGYYRSNGTYVMGYYRNSGTRSFNSFSNPRTVRVMGYYRSNGTYVQPHIRTAPDGIRSNNFSYRGY